MKQDKYIGMDVHQATTVVAVMDAGGKIVLETVVPTEGAALIRFLQSLQGRLRVTFEECGQAGWLYELVRGDVAEVIVCDPRRNRLLGEGSKADSGMPESGPSCGAPACCGRSIMVAMGPRH